MNLFIGIVINFLPLLIAIIAHEVSHGWMAYWRGDDTAKRQGRLSLNPLRHIDPMGSVVVPAILLLSKVGFVIGWAKPVPGNYCNLKKPRKDTFLISAAGIVTNLYLALISALLTYLLPFIHSLTVQALANAFLINMVIINIIIAAFNLLPIPPLDGSKIFFGWINRPWAAKYVSAEREGLIAIVVLAFILPYLANLLGFNFHPLGWYLVNVTKLTASVLL